MDDNILLQLGVGGIFAILIIKEVIGLVKPTLEGKIGKDSEKGDCKVCQARLDQIVKQTDDLHNWHNVRNAEGGFVWYVPSAFEKAIERLASNIEAMTAAIQQFAGNERETRGILERLDRKVS